MTRPASDSHSPKVRLVAIDLDGTLLNDRKDVTDESIAALAEARRRGAIVVIASARPPRSVRPLYKRLQLDTLQINYNGALVWDEPNDTPVIHRPLSCDTANLLIRAARERFPDVAVNCEILDRWHTDRHDGRYVTETAKLFPPDVVAPLETFCDQPITKLMLQGPVETMTELDALLTQQFPDAMTLMHTDPDLLQIAAAGVSKASALVEIAARYGVPMGNVMAIGDAINDIQMLQTAGISVAMGNATSDVKAAADWVSPSNNEHGVCVALRRFGLCD